MGGSGWPAWPGLVRIILHGLDGRSLPPADLIGQFAFDGGRLRHTLLGLDGRALADRRLRLAYRLGPQGWVSPDSPVWLEEF
jgi:hypothetical protein